MESRRPTYYEVLNIEPSASAQEIRKQYIALAAVHHPDREEGSTEAFQALNEAYHTLIDPEKRLQYDRGIQADISIQTHSSVALTYRDVDRTLLASKLIELLDLPTDAHTLTQSQSATHKQLKEHPGLLARYDSRTYTLYIEHYIPGFKNIQSVSFHLDIPEDGPHAGKLVIDQYPVEHNQYHFIKTYLDALKNKIGFMLSIDDVIDGRPRLAIEFWKMSNDFFALIDAGAKLDVTDKDGQKPFENIPFRMTAIYISVDTLMQLSEHFKNFSQDQHYASSCAGYKFAYSNASPIAATIYYANNYQLLLQSWDKRKASFDRENFKTIPVEVVTQHFLAPLTKPQTINLSHAMKVFRDKREQSYLLLDEFQDKLLTTICDNPFLHDLIRASQKHKEAIALSIVLDQQHQNQLKKILSISLLETRTPVSGLLGLFKTSKSSPETPNVYYPQNPALPAPDNRAEPMIHFLNQACKNPMQALKELNPEDALFKNNANTVGLSKASFLGLKWKSKPLSMAGARLIELAQLAALYHMVIAGTLIPQEDKPLLTQNNKYIAAIFDQRKIAGKEEIKTKINTLLVQLKAKHPSIANDDVFKNFFFRLYDHANKQKPGLIRRPANKNS